MWRRHKFRLFLRGVRKNGVATDSFPTENKCRRNMMLLGMYLIVTVIINMASTLN